MPIRLLAFLLLLLAVPSFAQDEPTLDTTTLTAREALQIPIRTRFAEIISPVNDNFYMHFSGSAFCLNAMLGIIGQCAEIDRRINVDPESISWSPDGRYVAFTSNALVYLDDSDIWVLEVETGVFTNLTDDGFDDRLQFRPDEELPENVGVDLAPEWMPDGRLSFIRHAVDFEQHQPQLWVIDPAGGEPEMLAELVAPSGFRSYVYNTDWSPDGTKLAFIYDSLNNPEAGLWIYDTAADEAQALVVVTETDPYYIRADFSPDGESLLLLTAAREVYRRGAYDSMESSGYYVVSVASGDVQPLDPEPFVMAAGWLPDGGLIFIGHEEEDRPASGLFVTTAPDAEPRKVLDYAEYEGESLRYYAPTMAMYRPLNVSAGGRLLLGTFEDVTLLVQLE